jgi:nucleotide-binding universal stress UspA family protein
VEILICTDGSKPSIQAADYISKFGFPGPTQVTILGVSEGSGDVEKLNASMDIIENGLRANYLITRKMRTGSPIDEILAEAIENSFDLVIVGGGGSQLGLLHPQVGSTTAKLARKLHTHFLVVRNIPKKLEKVLFCAGADAPSSETMSLGGSWIQRTNAQIGLLHVIPLTNESSTTKSVGKKQNQDQLIEQSSQQLRNAGVKSKIVPIIRQGLVVDEVLKEISEGNYELLVVGSHYQPGQDLWQGTLFDDITDQLINRSNSTILII